MIALRYSCHSNNKMDRLKRSATQNIRLLSIHDDSYKIYGTTGREYNIKIEEPSMTCTCVDFKMKQKYCKHIYFIFLNIYKIIPQLGTCYSIEELKAFHRTFFEKSKVRDDDEPCSICFEEIQTPLVCEKCKNGFHQQCINEMIKFSGNSKCPLCRSHLLCKPNSLIQQVINL